MWTPSEDVVLTAFYRQHPPGVEFEVSPLVDVLKRSKAAIHCRANQLGLTFPRGKQPRDPAKPYESKAKFTDEERLANWAEKKTQWHKDNAHPMLGRSHSQETREKISSANKGRPVPASRVWAMLRTKAKNGTSAPNRVRGTWKAGWREIGGKRIYARSRWEANYARYLEFLKVHGEVMEWEHEPTTFWFEAIRRGARSYLPDFRVTWANGKVEYHECKGWMDRRSITKIKRMAKYHPDVVLIVKDAAWFKANRVKLSGLIKDWEAGK